MSKINLADPKEFQEYFEKMAKAIKLVGHSEDEQHYVNADVVNFGEEFSKIQSPCLVAMHMDTDPVRNGENIQEIVNGIVYVIVKKSYKPNYKQEILLKHFFKLFAAQNFSKPLFFQHKSTLSLLL